MCCEEQNLTKETESVLYFECFKKCQSKISKKEKSGAIDKAKEKARMNKEKAKAKIIENEEVQDQNQDKDKDKDDEEEYSSDKKKNKEYKEHLKKTKKKDTSGGWLGWIQKKASHLLPSLNPFGKQIKTKPKPKVDPITKLPQKEIRVRDYSDKIKDFVLDGVEEKQGDIKIDAMEQKKAKCNKQEVQ